MTLPVYIARSLPSICHNLCTTLTPPRHFERLLKLGLNFIPCPLYTPGPSTIKETSNRFKRDLYTKIFFAGQPSDWTEKQLSIRSNWTPPEQQIPLELRARTSVFTRKLNTFFKTRRVLPNLTPLQSQMLEKLKNSNEFIVLPADKNLGPCILERSTYTQLAFKNHLSDNSTYKQLSEEEATSRIAYIQGQIVSFLKDFKQVLTDPDLKYIKRSIAPDHLKDPFSYFYLLPKIHKTPWSTRPIVSCCGSITHGLARWLDQQLQPIVKKLPNYITSSLDLKQKLSQLSLDWSKVRLFTCDAISMYTNIDTDHALIVISDFLRRHPAYNDMAVEPIIKALEIVMRNNVFRFGDTFWLQISGSAMGTPPACMYATLYFAINELNFYPKFKQLVPFYFRYIDDGIGAWLIQHDEATDTAEWERFKTAFIFGNLRWTFSDKETSVDYLDLTLTVDPISGIHTRIYEKPHNLYLYIPPHSAHQPGILRSTTIGMIKRFYSLSSFQSDFVRSVISFFRRLCTRGYCPNVLRPLFREAIQRAQTTRSRHEDDTDGRIFLHLQYHPCDPPSRVIQSLFRDILLEPKDRAIRGHPLPICRNIVGAPTGINRLLVVNHRPPNLKNFLFPRKLREDINAPASSFITETP
jgi:hypothetical protein